jgi:hypothetical protein
MTLLLVLRTVLRRVEGQDCAGAVLNSYGSLRA